jgi:hypothetical protein
MSPAPDPRSRNPYAGAKAGRFHERARRRGERLPLYVQALELVRLVAELILRVALDEPILTP